MQPRFYPSTVGIVHVDPQHKWTPHSPSSSCGRLQPPALLKGPQSCLLPPPPPPSSEVLNDDTPHWAEIVPCVLTMPPAQKKMQYVSPAAPIRSHSDPPPLTRLSGSELENPKNRRAWRVMNQEASAFSQNPDAGGTSGTIDVCRERIVSLGSQTIRPVCPAESPRTMRAGPLGMARAMS